MRTATTWGIKHGETKRVLVHHPDEMGIQEQRDWVFSQPDPHPEFERFEIHESDAAFTTIRRLGKAPEPDSAKGKGRKT
jgi:hypothetical protein